MTDTASLSYKGKSIDLPVVVGTENEIGIDIQKLRAQTGWITLDDSYGNTGACESAITFIDGEKGILRYRGYPIEDLANNSTFIETAYLLIFGELPTKPELTRFSGLLTEHEAIHEGLRNHFEGFPSTAHPMAILSAMINAASCYQPVLMNPDQFEHFEESAARIMSKVRTIAAAAYKQSIGQPIMYPRPELSYTANFLHMMFSRPNRPYAPDPDIVRALDMILLLHGDHEQNCSTSTVRMVGSSQANLYAALAAGVCALWGPLHGGANQAVLKMLQEIHDGGGKPADFIAKAKDKDSGVRLMGFGHRVYKNFDPRAKLIKEACDRVLNKLGVNDALLDIARELEAAALNDEYFVERKLYPNVDFYSGIIMRAIGIPTNMFTVMFAIGRIPGWISHWREVHMADSPRIHRPRQIYTGPTRRAYKPIDQRG